MGRSRGSMIFVGVLFAVIFVVCFIGLMDLFRSFQESEVLTKVSMDLQSLGTLSLAIFLQTRRVDPENVKQHPAAKKVDPWGSVYRARGQGKGLEWGSNGPDRTPDTVDDIWLPIVAAAKRETGSLARTYTNTSNPDAAYSRSAQ